MPLSRDACLDSRHAERGLFRGAMLSLESVNDSIGASGKNVPGPVQAKVPPALWLKALT